MRGGCSNWWGSTLRCPDVPQRRLSVGQQQRVWVARALALEPEAARRKIEDLVRKLNARLGLTMVFVSHDLSQVGRVADRVVLLAEGKSVGEWEREDFFSAAGERARRFIAGRP
jgi:ABC-type glutathione transport system ATPase component